MAFALVCGYAAVWTLYGVISKSSQDVNADMAEMVIWAREPALGYPKHPPFLAYVLNLWFSIFPNTDWAYTLLAVITVSAGIFIAFEIAGVWLDREKQAATPFLLAVIPFYNFLGLKFDQNSALIPLWALTILAFLRSLQTPHLGWAALTGLAAAAAMLTKYWSALLLAALGLTALLDSRRAVYLRSAAPLVTALVLFLAVLPHAIWLVRENFPPLTWIGSRRMTHSATEFLHSLAEHVAGTVGYAIVALGLVAILTRPSAAAVRDSWFAYDPARRPATLLFWTPLLLPLVVAPALHSNLLSLWNAPAYGLLPVMMLRSPLLLMPRLALMRLAAIVTALMLTIAVSSPIVALVFLKFGVENNAAYAKLAADAVEREWRETCKCRLQLVGGSWTLADAAAFYMTDRPSTYGDFSRYVSPWVDEARLAKEGIAIICPAEDNGCLAGMNALTRAGPPGRRTEVTLTRHWLGLAGEPKRFVIATVPPRT